MRRHIAVLAMLLFPLSALGAEAEVALMEANVDLEDKAALQRGARTFVNYCLSCHGAQYMRYNRMAADLGIGEEVVKSNMLFATDKIGSTMEVAMRPAQAEKWFGIAPPDLSVIARARGADWLYTYLLSFYADPDPARPFGVNNLVFPSTAMPAVLAPLQGRQVLVEKEADAHGAEHGPAHALELVEEGAQNPAQFRRTVRELVGFLVYVGEPAKMVRYELGAWVLLFLAILFFLSRALYKEYWKDLH